MNDLLKSFEGCRPARPESLKRLQGRWPHAVPDDYLSFMATSNGGEGPVGEAGYLHLWPVEDLETQSRDYDSEDVAPHLLLFGTDLGGTVYAFDTRATDQRLLAVPLPIEEEYAEVLGHSFREFLTALGRPG